MAEQDEIQQIFDQAFQQAQEERFSQTAELLTSLSPEEQAEVLGQLPDEHAVEVFRYLETGYQEQLLEHLSQQQVARLVEKLAPDDRARLLEHMPGPLAKNLLSGLSSRERRMTALLLGYPEQSAGRYMTPEYLALSPGMSAAEALEVVRRSGQQAETVYVLPVLDEGRHYLGVVHLRDLVMADPAEHVEDIIDHGIEAVPATHDRELTARLIQDTDALAAPVVDHQNRLLGLVTMDDAMDILGQEEGEDLARAGAAEPLNRPYFTVSVLHLARARVVWLLVLTVAAAMTVSVLKTFEATLDEVVALALFVPLLIGTGGNCGAQSATTMVRAMSLGEVAKADLLRVVLRETMVGLLLGTMLSLISIGPVWFFAGWEIAAVIALTLVTVCALATMVGSLVPMVARRLGIDPTVASAPFITTLIDTTGLIVYFLIAQAIIF